MPTVVTVDNITVLSDIGLNTVRLAHGGATTTKYEFWNPDAMAPDMPDHMDVMIKNRNPYTPTEKFVIKNNKNNVSFTIPDNFTGLTEIIYQ
jgi:hypothetical protein